MLEILTAFFGMVLVDVTFTFYVIKATEGKAYASGAYAALMTLINGMVTLAYVNSKLMLLPAAAGAFVGSVLAIKLNQRMRLKDV